MKIAPLIRAFSSHAGTQPLIVHTGQHYDAGLSDVFFRELGIPAPDHALGVGSSASRAEQIEKISVAFEPVLEQEQPDVVLVVGDVNSTIACASIAKKHNVRVAHVEAGLRSFDQEMPEEHNRVATDRISDFLYVTEESGMRNLARERVPGTAVLVGNCMIDTLVRDLDRARASSKRAELGLEPGAYVVSTFHRPSNVDTADALQGLLETLRVITALVALVLPMHPRTRKSMERFGLTAELNAVPRLTLCEPLGYVDFIGLVDQSLATVTDSGGIQEETTYLGVPCLTMRENTERPVTVDVGTNTLVGSDRESLARCLTQIRAGTYKKGAIPALWDGKAAERIALHLLAACS